MGLALDFVESNFFLNLGPPERQCVLDAFSSKEIWLLLHLNKWNTDRECISIPQSLVALNHLTSGQGHQ